MIHIISEDTNDYNVLENNSLSLFQIEAKQHLMIFDIDTVLSLLFV